jgi:hypothetical protein
MKNLVFFLILIVISCNQQRKDTQIIKSEELNINEEKNFGKEKELIGIAGYDFDDETIKGTLGTFYEWYINAMKKEGDPIYVPFVYRGIDGFTKIEKQICIENLKKHKISERYLKKINDDCEKCENNTNKIPYDSLFIVYPDNDSFGSTGCFFQEVNYWINQQGDCSWVKIGKMKKITDDTVNVLVYVDWYERPQFAIKMVKESGIWFIDSVCDY